MNIHRSALKLDNTYLTIYQKYRRNVGMLNILNHFLPMYIMRTIYCSSILSHLQYFTLFWENSYCTNLNKLRILQRKVIRIITNPQYIAYTDPLFSKLKLLKLNDLYKHKLGILCINPLMANSQIACHQCSCEQKIFITTILETEMGITSSTSEQTA